MDEDGIPTCLTAVITVGRFEVPSDGTDITKAISSGKVSKDADEVIRPRLVTAARAEGRAVRRPYTPTLGSATILRQAYDASLTWLLMGLRGISYAAKNVAVHEGTCPTTGS